MVQNYNKNTRLHQPATDSRLSTFCYRLSTNYALLFAYFYTNN